MGLGPEKPTRSGKVWILRECSYTTTHATQQQHLQKPPKTSHRVRAAQTETWRFQLLGFAGSEASTHQSQGWLGLQDAPLVGRKTKVGTQTTSILYIGNQIKQAIYRACSYRHRESNLHWIFWLFCFHVMFFFLEMGWTNPYNKWPKIVHG